MCSSPLLSRKWNSMADLRRWRPRGEAGVVVVVVEAEDVAAEAGRLEVVGRHAW